MITTVAFFKHLSSSSERELDEEWGRAPRREVDTGISSIVHMRVFSVRKYIRNQMNGPGWPMIDDHLRSAKEATGSSFGDRPLDVDSLEQSGSAYAGL